MHSASGAHHLPRLQRQLGEEGTLQAWWPSGDGTCTSVPPPWKSTPGIRYPSVGTTEESPLGTGERETSLIMMNGIFL